MKSIKLLTDWERAEGDTVTAGTTVEVEEAVAEKLIADGAAEAVGSEGAVTANQSAEEVEAAKQARIVELEGKGELTEEEQTELDTLKGDAE